MSVSRAKLATVLTMGLVLLGARGALGNTITFVESGSVGPSPGLPTSTKAVLTTSTDTVELDLFNLIVDPTSVIQNISGFGFDISPSSPVSLTSGTGTARTVNGDKTYTDGGAVDLNGPWALGSITGYDVFIDALGGGQPKFTIIGLPGANNLYNNANSSLVNNPPPNKQFDSHNPFTSSSSAVFFFHIAGVTDQTVVTAAIFQFGTAAGTDVPGTSCTPGVDCPTPTPTGDSPVPEPTSLVLLGSGLVGLAGAYRRRKSLKS